MRFLPSLSPKARRRFSEQLARGLAVAVLIAIAAWPAAASVLEAPAQQRAAAIISPAPLARVRGVVSITGSAMHPEFERYELYYTIEPGENWVFIGEAKFQQVENGLLGTWDTTSLPDGTYSLRLRVVRRDGNYDEAYQRNIVVANQAPPEPTPTPTLAELPTLPPPVAAPGATPTPEATPTPATVELPEIATPTPRPSPSPTPTANVAANADSGSGSGGSPLDALNTLSLRDAALTGIGYAGGAFLAVGVFFGVRRLLTWLWYLIAP